MSTMLTQQDAIQETFSGLAFPVVKVRYAGPTDTLGARYIATIRNGGNQRADIRHVAHFQYELSPSENAYRAARAAWGKYQTSFMRNVAEYPTVLIPGDLSDDAYCFVAVPLRFLEQ